MCRSGSTERRVRSQLRAGRHDHHVCRQNCQVRPRFFSLSDRLSLVFQSWFFFIFSWPSLVFDVIEPNFSTYILRCYYNLNIKRPVRIAQCRPTSKRNEKLKAWHFGAVSDVKIWRPAGMELTLTFHIAFFSARDINNDSTHSQHCQWHADELSKFSSPMFTCVRLSLSAGATESILLLNMCRCAEQRTSCDACTVNCARSMQSYKGSHRCNITADDADNGESPRLAYCFSCCNKQECSKVCEVYHNRECQQLRFDVCRLYSDACSTQQHRLSLI